MSIHLSRARFAALLAVVAALFASGLVVGAAGDPLILGSLVNNSGASGTKVTTSVNGNAFAVSQTGAGASANGIRGDANTGTGGVFTSSSNNALFASVASGNRFAMVAVNSGTAGTGGGLLALGNANPGLVVDVDSNSVDPIEVNSTGLVDNLNSDLLDSYHANGLNRVAFTSNAALADGDATSTGTLTVTITTPGWGYLMIWGQSLMYFEGSDGDDEVTCEAFVDNVAVPGAFAWQDISYHGSTTDDDDDACGVQGGYTVCNAATYTVDFDVNGLGADTDADDSTLMVEYVPFNGAGNTPFLSCLIVLEPTVHPAHGAKTLE